MPTATKTLEIPALHQSTYEVMRCPTSYAAMREGKKMPASMQSWRGTEIHHIAALYAEHCANNSVSADWDYFDVLTASVGEEAGTILERMRDSYLIDWKHLLTTELTLALDEDLNPIDDPLVREFTSVEMMPEDTPAAHRGTLDALYLYEDDSALVDDYKSHFQPFDPETYQAMLYPFMVMKYFPAVRRVTFRLRFVRFENLVREVTWEREDMPKMERKIRQARGLQQKIELQILNNEPLQAFAHAGCHYCPLSANLTDCPISEFNPEINRSMESRANFDRWWTMLATDNRKVLKDYVQTTGNPISITDGTGESWQYGAIPTAKKRYPLTENLIHALLDNCQATGEALYSIERGKGLNVYLGSGLTTKLKTKKRAALREIVEESFTDMKPGTKFGMAKVKGDGTLEEDEQGRSYGEDDED
jgi:hypothetical protein